jgi:hypothetical protein
MINKRSNDANKSKPYKIIAMLSLKSYELAGFELMILCGEADEADLMPQRLPPGLFEVKFYNTGSREEGIAIANEAKEIMVSSLNTINT